MTGCDFMTGNLLFGDCAETLKTINDESVDLIVTDPPYGYSFMNLSWDKALPSLQALQQCCRVLKHGSFCFVMCSPRQDMLWRMMSRLEEAGFNTNFSFISWVYAQGFAKSANVSKLIDKKLGAERTEGERIWSGGKRTGGVLGKNEGIQHEVRYGVPASPEGKAFTGAYVGSQLKPAQEVIIVVMKPLSEGSYTDQALKNGKGVLWLDDCKIPYANDDDKESARYGTQMDITGGNLKNPHGVHGKNVLASEDGRFPANLLCCDDILNDGYVHTSCKSKTIHEEYGDSFKFGGGLSTPDNQYGDSGSFSRYFDLDAWFKSRLPKEAQLTYPCLVVPKASLSEKNKYCENNHPTVKPLKLMSYLITMGSREGDLVLDPFVGSGTTLEAASILKRRFIGCELSEEYRDILEARAYQRSFVRVDEEREDAGVDFWL